MAITVMFYYTLLILLASIMAAAFCLSGYLVSHRRILGFASFGFLCYFLDVALVFQDDFLLRGGSAVIESVYFVGSQLPSVVTGAGIITSFWLCLCDFFEVKSKAAMAAPGVVFAAGSVVLFLLPAAVLWACSCSTACARRSWHGCFFSLRCAMRDRPTV